jgi:hypothetical protein
LLNFENSFKRNQAFSMKRALQILTHKGMINGEQHLLQLKNKI